MNWKTIEQIAQNPDKKWYLSQKDVAVLLGCSRQHAAAFLVNQSVPFRRIGKERSYFLPEVLEAVDRTRWAKSEDSKYPKRSISP